MNLGTGSNPAALLVALTCGPQSIYCVPTMRKVLGPQPCPSQPVSYDIHTRGGSFSCNRVKCYQRHSVEYCFREWSRGLIFVDNAIAEENILVTVEC